MDLYALSNVFIKLKMWPVFEVNHYILMSLNFKKDLHNTVPFVFERRHPLASWVATMMLCFTGGIFTCLLLGKPFAILFTHHEKLAAASLMWYLINYIPGISTILSSRPLMTVIILIKEIQRVYGIYGGVQQGIEEFPTFYLVPFTLGFLRGCGAEVMMFFARLMAGVLKVNSHQFVAPNVLLHPSSVFKASAVISAIFVLESMAMVNIEHRLLFSGIILTMLCIRIPMVWGLLGDPFAPFENLICSIAFGGMWDAYLRVRDSKTTSTTTKTKTRAASTSSSMHTSNGELKLKRH